jgi:hypothetical protein
MTPSECSAGREEHKQNNLKGVFRLMATTYKWQFAPRFRRKAFGWKSDTPILRINEALTEIKAAAKKEPMLAAEGRSTAP